jgi:hypothetical protein
MEFLKKEKVTEIYLCINNMDNVGQPTSLEVRTFVKKVKGYGMRVAALVDSIDSKEKTICINPSNQSYYDNVLSKFVAYQKVAVGDEKFYALHLDIEPEGCSDFDSSSTNHMQWFADFVIGKARSAANKASAELDVDVGYWYDSYNVKDNSVTPALNIKLDEFLVKYADTNIVMSYRKSADLIMSVSKKVIALAKKHNKKIVLSAETMNLGYNNPVHDNNNASFYDLGKIFMDGELLKVKERLGTEFPNKKYGLAVHYMSSWYTMSEKPTSTIKGEMKQTSDSIASSAKMSYILADLDNETDEKSGGCDISIYSCLVFALFGLLPFVQRKRK